MKQRKILRNKNSKEVHIVHYHHSEESKKFCNLCRLGISGGHDKFLTKKEDRDDLR